MRDIPLIGIEELKEHEDIWPSYLEELKNQIMLDGILKMPIAVDRNTYVILDGHHRVQALRRLGCSKIPVVFVDYKSPAIKVLAQREGEVITKEMVIDAALRDKKMPPKSSRHMVLVNGEFQHISVIEIFVNISLDHLR